MLVHIAGSYRQVISPGRIFKLAKHYIAGSAIFDPYRQVSFLAKTFLGAVPIQESSGHKQNSYKTNTMASLSRPACALCQTETFEKCPWQLACLHCVCQDCEDTRELTEHEDCLVCWKPALPAAQNHALFEYAKALGEGHHNMETDVDCVLPSSAKKARVEQDWTGLAPTKGPFDMVWSARIDVIERAKAGVERDLAAKQATLKAEYDAMLTRFQDKCAQYEHVLKSKFNVHKAELNIAARASCKDLSIQISSAEAHIPNWSHVAADSQDARMAIASVSFPAPLPLPSLRDDMKGLVDSWSDPAPQQYAISTTGQIFCGKDHYANHKVNSVTKLFKDEVTARREMAALTAADLWEEKHRVEVGPGYGYSVSLFTKLDKLRAACAPGQLDVVISMIVSLQALNWHFRSSKHVWVSIRPLFPDVPFSNPVSMKETFIPDDMKASILELLPNVPVSNAGPADFGRCICNN